MRRALALAGAALLCALGAPAPVPAPAGAQEAQQEPRARLTVDTVETSGALGADVRVQVTVANVSGDTLEDLHITTRRGDAATDTAQAAQQLEGGAFPYYGVVAQTQALAPGAQTQLTMTVPTGLGADGTLAIEQPGAYPLMFALTGTVDGDPVALADDRMLLHFGETQATGGINVVYPLTENVDIVPGETGGSALILQSERLADSLTEGRLNALLSEYEQHDLRGAGCVAVDPALLDAVDRMADGYTVASARPAVSDRPKRLRDSWFRGSDDERGVPGTGAEAARDWLDRLAQVDCVMAMPWANADLDSVAKANNDTLLADAASRGAGTIARVLGRDPDNDLLAVGSPTVGAALRQPPLLADGAAWAGRSATYDGALAQMLQDPDSAAAALALAAQDGPAPAAASDEAAGDDPAAPPAGTPHDVVAKLPNYQTPAGARAALDEAEALLRTAHAGTLAAHDPAPEAAVPQLDAAFADNEILQVEQQAHYTDELMNMMVNDPNIALTRLDFTQPLRGDLLTALSLNTAFDSARMAANAAALQDLRGSVALIPPGNVYTRASASSPLLIVAENGLPLPVKATLDYEAPGDASLNTPEEVTLPAKGSITVSMTANLPDDVRRDIRLWLATPAGDTISQPVFISVQTRAGTLGLYKLGGIVALLAVAALGLRFLRARRASTARTRAHDPEAQK